MTKIIFEGEVKQGDINIEDFGSAIIVEPE